jgi:hypothetical protein
MVLALAVLFEDLIDPTGRQRSLQRQPRHHARRRMFFESLNDSLPHLILIRIRNRINYPRPSTDAFDTGRVLLKGTQSFTETLLNSSHRIKYAVVKILFPKLLP